MGFTLINVPNFVALKPAVYVRLVDGAMASPRKCHRSQWIELSGSEGDRLVRVPCWHGGLGARISPPVT